MGRDVAGGFVLRFARWDRDLYGVHWKRRHPRDVMRVSIVHCSAPSIGRAEGPPLHHKSADAAPYVHFPRHEKNTCPRSVHTIIEGMAGLTRNFPQHGQEGFEMPI